MNSHEMTTLVSVVNIFVRWQRLGHTDVIVPRPRRNHKWVALSDIKHDI